MSRDEAVTVLNATSHIRIAGLLTELPKGRYTYDLRPLNPAYPPQFHLILEKTAPTIDLALPAPGLYDITITDTLDTPRIDLFLAAIGPAQSPEFESFHHAKEVMAQVGPYTTLCAPTLNRSRRVRSHSPLRKSDKYSQRSGYHWTAPS
jgi:hypothetical protein